MGSKLPFVIALVLLSPAALAQSPPAAPGQPPPPQAQSPTPEKVPRNTLIVKGAWASASDAVTPLPEGGSMAGGAYTNQYFGLSYALPPDWYEKYKGPPPSDSGRYVLAQIRPPDTFPGSARGSVLIAAQDMFFSLLPAGNAVELVKQMKDALPAEYKVEREPASVTLANRAFVRLDYFAPAAGLHWYTLATEIRCHMVQFVFTSRDAQLLERLVEGMSALKLPVEADPSRGEGGGEAPVCIPDYATQENVTHRVDPVLTERRFNPIPVRIIVGQDGKVKHIHFISAFPEQAKAITDALWQWRFKPYVREGQPVEVETGILFGSSPRRKPPASFPAKPAGTN